MISALPDTAGLYFNFKYNDMPLDKLLPMYSTLDDGYDALLYIPKMEPDAPYGIEIYSNEQMSLTTKIYLESIIEDQLEAINLKMRS